MYQDPDLNRHFFRSFSAELQKRAAVVTEAEAKAAADKAKALITKRDLGAFAAGAGTLYGANRIVKDVATGERIRKQQAQGGY